MTRREWRIPVEQPFWAYVPVYARQWDPSGVYNTNLGRIELRYPETQSNPYEPILVGTYTAGDSSGDLEAHFVPFKKALSGFWRRKYPAGGAVSTQYGRFIFMFSEDGRGFDGYWSYGNTVPSPDPNKVWSGQKL